MLHAASRYSQQLKQTSSGFVFYYFTFTKLSSLLPLVSVTCLEYMLYIYIIQSTKSL